MRWPAVEVLSIELDVCRRSYVATVRCADGSTFGPAPVWDLKRRVNWQLREQLEARVHTHKLEKVGVDEHADQDSRRSESLTSALDEWKPNARSRCKAVDELLTVHCDLPPELPSED